MSEIKAPAPAPCGSCPYRRDVPSGVWSAEEYAKLPLFDRPTPEQPPSVFMCHQQDGRLCAGWTAVHDMDNSLGLRIAAGFGLLANGVMEAARRYATSTPLFSSGREAAEHGMAEINSPGIKARRLVAKLGRKQAKEPA
jgi:hypothetical protein